MASVAGERSRRRRWSQLVTESAAAVGDRAAARWLCEVASGANRLDDVLDEPATPRMVAHLDHMVERCRRGEPLGYVLGQWTFRYVEVAVDRRVLIPRPETEVVAGIAIDLARALVPPVTVADLGTGSGAIGLALASELPIDGVTVWLTDASADALDLARANCAGLGRPAANVRIASPGSWFDALPPGTVIDLAVANPPYIAEDSPDVADSVRDWEPSSALFAGADGLREIRRIVADARDWVRPGGWLVMEIGSDQGSPVESLLHQTGYDSVEIRRDLAGRNRIALARVPT